MREDQNNADRILGLEREERENLDRESPLKNNGKFYINLIFDEQSILATL